MPTNKLWIEHTERAAWESVEALRDKLADAEKRLQRMAPPLEGWRGVFDALEQAGQRHVLSGATYAEWMRSLLERLEDAEAKARSLEEELSRARQSSSTHSTVASVAPLGLAARRETDYLDDDDDLDPSPREARSRSGARFFAAVERRYKKELREGPRGDLDALIAALESKVDDLADLDEPELADAAVDLAVLAMRLEREAKRSR
jgi:hypothetical protein